MESPAEGKWGLGQRGWVSAYPSQTAVVGVRLALRLGVWVCSVDRKKTCPGHRQWLRETSPLRVLWISSTSSLILLLPTWTPPTPSCAPSGVWLALGHGSWAPEGGSPGRIGYETQYHVSCVSSMWCGRGRGPRTFRSLREPRCVWMRVEGSKSSPQLHSIAHQVTCHRASALGSSLSGFGGGHEAISGGSGSSLHSRPEQWEPTHRLGMREY